MTNRIKVIYIAGYGRSGSTILDIILGDHSQIESVGELVNAPKAWNSKSEYCSCGELAGKCLFWLEVQNEWKNTIPFSTTYNDWQKLQTSFEQLKKLPHILAGYYLNTLPFRKYSTGIERLYRAIAAVSGKKIIVDSSKNPIRALAISQINDIDLHIIHLVRDGRGVAWSLKKSYKRNPKAGVQNHIRAKPVWRSAMLWCVINQLTELTTYSLLPNKWLRIRYEDIISDPKESLEKIGHAINADFTKVQTKLENKGIFTANHSISGNRVRMCGPIKIHSNFEWQQQLSKSQSTLFWIIAGFKARKYGYKKEYQ